MSDHRTQFEATAGGLALTNAILLYRSQPIRNASPYATARAGAAAFASIHAIEHDDEGKPIIGAGTSLSRAHLREVVWGDINEAPSRSLDTHVSRLRTKLELTEAYGYTISAIYGMGYRLDPVET